jgi:hypothetical protein
MGRRGCCRVNSDIGGSKPRPAGVNVSTPAVTIAGIELMHRIRKGQFGLGRLGVQGRAAPAAWNAVLGA